MTNGVTSYFGNIQITGTIVITVAVGGRKDFVVLNPLGKYVYYVVSICIIICYVCILCSAVYMRKQFQYENNLLHYRK